MVKRVVESRLQKAVLVAGSSLNYFHTIVPLFWGRKVLAFEVRDMCGIGHRKPGEYSLSVLGDQARSVAPPEGRSLKELNFELEFEHVAPTE